MKEFDNLLKTLGKFEGVTITHHNLEVEMYIMFKCTSDLSLSVITNQIMEIQDSHSCNFSIYPDPEDSSKVIYRINFQFKKAFSALNKLLKSYLETGSLAKAKQKELGLPDLSLVTIRQMATELKRRENLCFALVWIEDNERDNIAIEGSGNPTQLVGLLARGTHMAIEWADRNIKFHRPKDE